MEPHQALTTRLGFEGYLGVTYLLTYLVLCILKNNAAVSQLPMRQCACNEHECFKNNQITQTPNESELRGTNAVT